MHDQWIERISDSIDGLLPESDELALRQHLAECAECRTVATELANVVAAARNAADTGPERDLWPAIAARIDASGAAPLPMPARPATLAGMTPLSIRSRVERPGRRFSFSAPQLAAAAVVLMALSGTAVWLASSSPTEPAVAAGTIIQSAGGQPRSTQPVAAIAEPPEYDENVADLERALDENRASLDPATVEIIEQSLDAIDRAIEDARTALAADPGNPYLHRQLDNTMRKKIDVLRRATGAQRAQS